MSSSQLFVIGYNYSGDLGLNQYEEVNILTPCPEKKFPKHFQDVNTQYTDNNYNNLWSAGDNTRGSCAIGKKQTKLKN